MNKQNIEDGRIDVRNDLSYLGFVGFVIASMSGFFAQWHAGEFEPLISGICLFCLAYAIFMFINLIDSVTFKGSSAILEKKFKRYTFDQISHVTVIYLPWSALVVLILRGDGTKRKEGHWLYVKPIYDKLISVLRANDIDFNEKPI